MADSLPQSRINERNITNEMRESFLDYAMSVIVSRALPDVRDGWGRYGEISSTRRLFNL